MSSMFRFSLVSSSSFFLARPATDDLATLRALTGWMRVKGFKAILGGKMREGPAWMKGSSDADGLSGAVTGAGGSVRVAELVGRVEERADSGIVCAGVADSPDISEIFC